MKVFASPSSVILMGSILASSSMLVGCGGGSGDGGDQPATTESTSTPLTPLTPATPVTPEQPSTPLTPLTPATPVTPEKPTTPLTPLTPATPISPSVDNNSLVETATLPTMPVNHQPLSAVGDAAAISALSKGIYTTSSTLKLLSIGGGEVDCPASGDVNCAGIVRYQLDQNNKLTFSAWAYMPNSKKWIQFSERNGAFDQLFDFGELYSDGASWSQSSLNLSKLSARTTATTLSYHLGGTELSVVGNTTAATTAKANSSMSGVGYSNNAKAFSYRVGITQGEYMTLKKAGMWKKADDGNSYKNLAAFRAAHQQKNQALCLTADSSSQGVVFNPNQIGAQFVQLHGICDLQIDEKVPLIHTQEGVKSIAGREVIYLGQNPNSIFQKSNSESQFLWALALTDEGIPAQGKAYQKGYMKNINKEFYNEAAVIEWLKAKHGYNANLALPQ